MTTQTCKCDPNSATDPGHWLVLQRFGHEVECPDFPIYCACEFTDRYDSDCACCNNRRVHRQADNVECAAAPLLQGAQT